jgi:hypothetical protein
MNTDLGSAGVSPADGSALVHPRVLLRETRSRATETVALPNPCLSVFIRG